MGLLDKLRARPRRSAGHATEASPSNSPRPLRSTGCDWTRRLPRPVLAYIFALTCPHTLDDSYDTSEESMSDGCMLCDMRDLAHCAQVCRRWFIEARVLLYTHIRIDPVHYCELEVQLAAKRKRRSFFDRNGDPIDAPQVRLELLMRTVREDQKLANRVLSLRMPYMTREANKANIARTISVLHNLRFVDLPSGLFSDEPSCTALKQELIVQCPDLRRISYRHGAEGSFARLPGSQLWTNLEKLELSGLQIEAGTLRNGLASFSKLRDLTLEDMPWLDDSAFLMRPPFPPIPALLNLTIRDTPNVTAAGIVSFLSSPYTQNALQSLTLSSTDVIPSTLHQILAAAPRLTSLSIIQDVRRSFPAEQVPPLTSNSLRLLHFEITSETETHGLPPVAGSYYTYLISSLMSRSLPALRDLYVRDANFPDTLLLAPPPRLFGGGEDGPQLRNRGLTQPLNVYSKGLDELEWNFTPYDPGTVYGRGGAKTRPVSFHEAQLNRSWGGDSRKSVLVGNGFGGFLAVPADENERPKSSGGYKRSSRQDLWR
ncbi:hypothetical protein N7532_007695 [Penicillium argentinense]|uniref:F-box domain-containing protein n=1 Tax=Penicillium argentinense TaxID=1131581 RepID=A0A9W9K1A9_9EURO|nr:uncharacterized protein N7532_007695 [Penicillium argentinense]KAJ5089011.1 hypothetical protein N7532_007695 [Penicillium argentinense]